MENLHTLPNDVTINPPSFWFWVKAGFGFGVGAVMVLIVTWLVMLLGLGTILKVGLHGLGF
jgi:hypothetical protein